jgi:hypothetical protein
MSTNNVFWPFSVFPAINLHVHEWKIMKINNVMIKVYNIPKFWSLMQSVERMLYTPSGLKYKQRVSFAISKIIVFVVNAPTSSTH